MRKSSAAGLVVAVAAASVVAVTTPALAATWTVTPGGSVTGTAGTTKWHDNTTNRDLPCTSSSVHSTLKNGTGLTNPIGTITSVTFTGCSAFGYSYTVRAGALPWSLNALSYSAPTTTVSITGVHFTWSALGCSLTVDGTSATANDGTITGTYDNTTGGLTTRGGTLKIYNASGCLGLFNSGDSMTLFDTYAISPVQTITSP